MLVLVDGSHLLGLVLIQELDPVGDALIETGHLVGIEIR